MNKNYFRGGLQLHSQEFGVWNIDCNIVSVIRWPSLDE